MLLVAVEFWAAAATKKSSFLEERSLRADVLQKLADELRGLDDDDELRGPDDDEIRGPDGDDELWSPDDDELRGPGPAFRPCPRFGSDGGHLYQLVVGTARHVFSTDDDDDQQTLTKLLSLFPWPEDGEEEGVDYADLYAWIWEEPQWTEPGTQIVETTDDATQRRRRRAASEPVLNLSSAPSPTSSSSSADSPTAPPSSVPSPTSATRVAKPLNSELYSSRRSGLTDRTIARKSLQLRDAVFQLGDAHCVLEVLEHFLESSEMRRLLPEHLKKTTKETLVQEKMALAAREMLSRHFATRGQRNTDDRNFFIGALVAMLPKDLSEMRLGKQVQRSLGVSKNQIRRAVQIRTKMMDRADGWCRLCDKPHCDRVDGAIIEEAWHDDLLSREDNSDKRPVRIPIGVDEETGDKQYCIHWKRTQIGTDKDALATFRSSSFCQRVRDETKTKTRPNGVRVGMKLFLKFRCRCVKKKKAGECDCPICTFIYVNLPRYHKARTGWYGVHTVATDDGGKVRRNKNTCTNTSCGGQCMNFDSAFRLHSRSLRDLESMSMCKPVPLPCISTPTMGCDACRRSQANVCDRCVFTTYHPNCTLGICKNCPRLAWPKDCPIEWAGSRATWEAYVPVQVGVDDKTGKPRYQDMLLPQYGTRSDFMEAWNRGVERYLPHIVQNRIQRQMKLRVEYRKGPTTITKLEDFAAQPEVVRSSNLTCAQREKHNECVCVVGHSPRTELFESTRRKRGKKKIRKTQKSVRIQTTGVFYGFSPTGRKPDSAYSTTVQRDIDSIIKDGISIYGEWFYNGQRIPRRGGHKRQCPAGFVDMSEPLDCSLRLRTLDKEFFITDGCGCQYDCGHTHYQTGVWKSKTGIERHHVKNVAYHGKCQCDGLSNVPKHLIQNAMKNNKTIDHGTRNLVLFLAKEHKPPTEKRPLYWSIDHYVFGYYDHNDFDLIGECPRATAFHGCRKVHACVGLAEDDNAKLRGPVWARSTFCYCPSCERYDFSNCELVKTLGPVKNFIDCAQLKYNKLSKPLPVTEHREANLALDAFAKEIKSGRVIACRIEESEGFSLALTVGPAIEADGDALYAGEPVKKGWWIVPIRWYNQDTQDDLKFTLESETVRREGFWFVVTAILRLPPLNFTKTSRRVSYLKEDTLFQIQAAL